MKINLASGELYLPGYINIDNKSHYNHATADLIADVFELELPELLIDEIIVSHFAMYIMGGPDSLDNPNQMRQLLQRWYSWLTPGGTLLMETGNLKFIVTHILNSKSSDEIQGGKGLKQIFGYGNTYGHKWAWCPETLTPLFEETGFVDVKVTPGIFHSKERDFVVFGKKPLN
jgi:hypothetical protein